MSETRAGDALMVPFIGFLVSVITPVSAVTGILRKIEVSKHRGVGNLLLENPSGWMLIRLWTVIRRRM